MKCDRSPERWTGSTGSGVNGAERCGVWTWRGVGERSWGEGRLSEGPVVGIAEGRAHTGHYNVHSSQNAEWDDTVTREVMALWGLNSMLNTTGSPWRATKQSNVIRLVFNKITQETVCGIEWKGKPADKYSWTKKCADLTHHQRKKQYFLTELH